MARAESYDVAIAGAGPAAMIIGKGLAQSGLRVVLLGFDDRPAPQASHVHLFKDSLWPRLFELVPDLEAQLQAEDAKTLPPAAIDRDIVPASETSVSPGSRRILEEQLRRATSCSAIVRRPERFRNAKHVQGIWKIEATGGTHLSAAWLIDATGSARSTARAVGDALGEPLPLDEADAEFSYTTWRFAGALPQDPCSGQQFWSSEFRIGAVVAPDDDYWLLTLQSVEPLPDPPPETPADILETIDDMQLAQICEGAEAVERPSRWTTAPITRMDLQPIASSDLPWFAIGDALVTTPPILGWGFEQIVEQCSAVGDSVVSNDLTAAFEPLMEASRVRFEQAIFAMVRRSGVLPQAPAKSPFPQLQGKIHVDSSA